MTTLSSLSCPSSISYSNRSFTETPYQYDGKAYNGKDRAALGFSVKRSEDQTRVGLFARVWPANIKLALFVACDAIIYQ